MAKIPLQPNRDVGSDPDYRYSFANERTFLAWIRTSLALVAGGLAVGQLANGLSPPWARYALGLLLVATGMALAVMSLVRWARREDAMRRDAPLPMSRLPVAATAAVVAVSIVAIGILALGSIGRG